LRADAAHVAEQEPKERPFIVIPARPIVIPAQAGIQGFRPFVFNALGPRLRGMTAVLLIA
jgi:hypothetical protein